ncbi:MAG TPA: EAL domain-containing protein [Acholeplasmataceae bacterium]|nr:EAL domain-containing protein [Acholeplasmataceae bacterium]
MQEKQIKRYQILLKLRKHKILNTIFVLVFMLLVYLIVNFTVQITGQFTYAHAMYIPILYASFVYNKKTSWIFGMIAGLLLGPLLMYDQFLMNWLFRLFFFVTISLLSSIAIDELREDSRLFSVNQDTNIPNQNVLKNQDIPLDNEASYAIYSIILNNCSILVDLFGMDIYEQVLIKIYNNLKQGFKKNTLIMQPEHDKFWIMGRLYNHEEDLKNLWEILKKQIVLGEIFIYVEYTIGMNVVKGGAAFDFDNYYRADIAARYAHKHSRFYAEFNESMIYQQQQFALIGEFTNAMKKGQFYLDYQPIIDLKTGSVSHFEALIRWYHPRQGLITPDTFIPLIEQTHLIHQLTEFVISEACKQVSLFQKQGIPIKTSVNISVKNLLDGRFVENITSLVKAAGISPAQIFLEIVETEMLDNSEITKNQILKLQEAGFSIAIDDFGKGYSSISYLSKYQVDAIKIDNTFNFNLHSDFTAGKIVRKMIDLAHELDLKVVCEGVENQESYLLLRNFGADFAQGYYFSRPIQDKSLLAWYQENVTNNIFLKI